MRTLPRPLRAAALGGSALVVGLGLVAPRVVGATGCDPMMDPSCGTSSDTWYDDTTSTDDTVWYDETTSSDDTVWYDDPSADPGDPTATTWSPSPDDPSGTTGYEDPTWSDDPDWSDDIPGPDHPPGFDDTAGFDDTVWYDDPLAGDGSVPGGGSFDRGVGGADAVVPPEVLAMVDDAPDRGEDFDPDALPLDHAVVTGAARLVLGIDALAELGAFRRDPDPVVNEAIRAVRDLIPADGLDADGYRSEVVALGDDVAGLVEAIGQAGPVSPALLDVDSAMASPELMARLERGDTAVLEPGVWLTAAADLALRGGVGTGGGTDDDLPAVVALAARLGGDGLVEPTTPTSQLADRSSTSATTIPQVPADDGVAADRGAGTPGPGLAIGAGAAAVVGLGAIALVAGRRRRRGRQAAGQAAPPNTAAQEREPAETPVPPALASRSASLEDLLDVSRRMTASLDEAEVAGIALSEAERMVGAEGGLVAVWDGNHFRVPCHRPDALFDLDALDAGSLRRVIETGRSIVQVTDDEPTLVEVPMAMAAIPIVTDGRVAGAILTVRVPSEPFARDELDGLEMLAPMIGSALKAAETHGSATQLADVDPLSGLNNRRRLTADLVAARDRSLVAIMIDIDHFKHFNDTNGHAAGDTAIRRVAELLSANVRPDDVVYRYGGEEFCILLGRADGDEAEAIGERVRAAVEESTIEGGEHQPAGRVTISVGVARSEPGAHDGVIEAADAALYRAKHGGRNRVVTALD